VAVVIGVRTKQAQNYTLIMSKAVTDSSPEKSMKVMRVGEGIPAIGKLSRDSGSTRTFNTDHLYMIYNW
jgi:hypothetical protein